VPLAREIREANISTVPYKIYNIGNSSPVQLMHYIKAIETHLGKKAIKQFLPMQPGDVPKTFADTSNLQKDLGYKPNTSVSHGIGEFIKWYHRYFK
jgi:UDP-glucuronate 4-epimerase